MDKQITVLLLLQLLTGCSKMPSKEQVSIVNIADCVLDTTSGPRTISVSSSPGYPHFVSGIISCRSEPISGALIRVKGTSLTTRSDGQGHYQLDAPVGAILQVMMLSYNCKEVQVPQQGSLNIQLTESM
ncbi:carboxypeptidase-like regulatory domain-containing protein [Hymenobacter metallicola]|uniref:Carboxypeptidase-like regulatory domain-containing protein n=1 Tax=Hymenobacter metallicola TaxID=2563114 RepID=A0A4Z0PWZ0_9BACT|nr:hypothetical protein E5K02_25310 [Hymenobacter metallicola]